jgi:hypothetical protein
MTLATRTVNRRRAMTMSDDRHHNKHVVGIRSPSKELADQVRDRAKSAGHGDLSALTVRFWRWYLREEGVTLPRRPPAELEDEQD